MYSVFIVVNVYLVLVYMQPFLDFLV